MIKCTVLLTDFGLVVLIWLVQLIIYPSFRHINRGAFVLWHGQYTQRISYVVVPLMLGQILGHGMVFYQEPNMIHGVGLIVIALVWLVTFMLSVPCHTALEKLGPNAEQITRLIKTNWLRTIGWSGVFLLALVEYVRVEF